MRDGCGATEPLLSAWVDGNLHSADHQRVDAHLRGCPPCRSEAEGLAATRQMLGSLPVRQAPDGLWEQAARRAGDPSAGQRRRVRRTVIAACFAASAASALAFALGEPEPLPQRTVEAPAEVFIADHLIRSSAVPGLAPTLVDDQ